MQKWSQEFIASMELTPQKRIPCQNSPGLCHSSSAGNPDWLCKHVAMVKYLKCTMQSFGYFFWLMMRLSVKLLDVLGATFFLLISSKIISPLGSWQVRTPKFGKSSTLQEDHGLTTSSFQESNVNTDEHHI